MHIDKELIDKIHGLLDKGLVKGLGYAKPGEMCVEAAINFALGRNHGDDPGCVAQSIRHLKIRLNDSSWSSNKARAEGMRRLAIAQLGTSTNFDELLFARKCALLVIHLWDAPDVVKQYLETGDRLLRNAATNAAATVYVAAQAASASAAAAAAVHAINAATNAATNYAAYAVSVAAYAASGYIGRSDLKSDKILSDFAESVVQILIEMKTPGSEWI